MAQHILDALLDVILLPLIAVIFASLLLRSKNYRNLLLALILLKATANGLFHLAVNGWLDVALMRPLRATLALITMIECVIAGRVVPAFTISADPGLKLVASPWVERLAPGLTAVGVAAYRLADNGGAGGRICGAVVAVFGLTLQAGAGQVLHLDFSSE